MLLKVLALHPLFKNGRWVAPELGLFILQQRTCRDYCGTSECAINDPLHCKKNSEPFGSENRHLWFASKASEYVIKDIIMRYLAPLCQTTVEDRVVASDRPILEAVC